MRLGAGEGQDSTAFLTAHARLSGFRQSVGRIIVCVTSNLVSGTVGRCCYHSSVGPLDPQRSVGPPDNKLEDTQTMILPTD